jgi:hypothetical protein
MSRCALGAEYGPYATLDFRRGDGWPTPPEQWHPPSLGGDHLTVAELPLSTLRSTVMVPAPASTATAP